MDPILIFKTFVLKKKLHDAIAYWDRHHDITDWDGGRGHESKVLQSVISQPTIQQLITDILTKTSIGKRWLSGDNTLSFQGGVSTDDHCNIYIIHMLAILRRRKIITLNPDLNRLFVSRPSNTAYVN